MSTPPRDPRPAARHSSSPVALPSGVRLGTEHGAEAILVETPAASAALHLDGAHLTRWTPAGGTDLLWVSPTSSYGPGLAIRGGIPLVGPWFGPGRSGDRPVKHGWLRTERWELTAARTLGDDVELTLASPAARRELAARLVVRIGRELDVELTLTAGPDALEVEAALHTYLAVSDIRRISIEGLGGAPYLDNTRGLAADVMPAGALTPDGPTDRVVDAAGTVRVVDPGAARTIVQEPRGTARTVVWTPWQEGAAGFEDMPAEAWTEFVCVEPAVAKESAVTLDPGTSLTLGVRYRLES